jgi:hypothetical protein
MYTEEEIQRISGAILPQFIPKDPAQTELSFHFTLPPKNFRVDYQKNAKGRWEFKGYKEAE